MKKFEYKTIKIDPKGNWTLKFDPEEIETTLNQLGREGWEF